MASSPPRPLSVWHRAAHLVAQDRRGLTLGVVFGIVAIVAISIESGVEAAMVAATSVVGLAVQFRMFLALLRAIESAIRGQLNRKELGLGLVLVAVAISLQVITRVPLTVTTAFAAAAAGLLFGVTLIIKKRR